MKITKSVMTTMEVIDDEKVKVGDVFKLTKNEGNWWKIPFNIEVLKVHKTYLVIKLEGDDTEITIPLEKLLKYTIEKVETSKLKQFQVGERYFVENTLSCNKFKATVIAVDVDMVLKTDNNKHIVVQESQIDNTFIFKKIENGCDSSKDVYKMFEEYLRNL